MDVNPRPGPTENLRQIDVVASALKSMAADPAVMSRLALASVIGKGESVWVFEIAFQLTRQGIRADREHSVGGIHRLDLVVGDEAFEVKSSFTRFAARSPLTVTHGWFYPDVAKLRRATVRGHQLITLATMISAEPRQATFDVSNIGRDPQDIEVERTRGISNYQGYATTVAEGETKHVDLGVGMVPSDGGKIQLDALLFCVHDPAGSVPADEQPKHVSTPSAQ